ncbi:MAG: hypothetical protein LAP38_16870 [Acidobacteriia bacterium]|nr:hypothetical protein [Terriglobia bacterium]
MAKQCPDCRSVAEDDIGYCGACGCQLPRTRQTSSRSSVWQYVAVVAAVGGAGASILFLLRTAAAH